MRRRFSVITVIVVILLGATLFLTHERILLAVGDFLVVQDGLQPADVIHVIAGSDERIDYGIELYQQGYGKQILFTGGSFLLHNENYGHRAKERAVKNGIPIEAIAIDDSKITSTFEEVVRLKEFITQSMVPINSVIVVSDPHHMRRSRWTYRQVLGDRVRLGMAPVPFELSPYKPKWWTECDSKKFVKDEYMKIIYYYARYKYSWGPLRKWLDSLDQD